MTRKASLAGFGLTIASAIAVFSACKATYAHEKSSGVATEGQRIFRFDTFGDEKFWTDTARMNGRRRAQARRRRQQTSSCIRPSSSSAEHSTAIRFST